MSPRREIESLPEVPWCTRVAELRKVAEGVGLPEALSKELPQKSWEEARKALQQLEAEPDFNVKSLTEWKWLLAARARDPDHQHVNDTTALFFSITEPCYVWNFRLRTWQRRPSKRHGWHMKSLGHCIMACLLRRLRQLAQPKVRRRAFS